MVFHRGFVDANFGDVCVVIGTGRSGGRILGEGCGGWFAERDAREGIEPIDGGEEEAGFAEDGLVALGDDLGVGFVGGGWGVVKHVQRGLES